jgi:hypothetical protein
MRATRKIYIKKLGNRSSFRNVVFFHCYLGKIRTMDKVGKPNISVCYTPSSEPYSIYMKDAIFWVAKPRRSVKYTDVSEERIT